ncbi:MAG: hypothetical protein D6694_03785, partial [Gammaproteobacteria bacterium]
NRIQIKITYTLEFLSAFHLGTGLPNGLIDRAIARNKDGYLYVPGSTIKGVVRHRCEQLAKLYGLEANEPHTEESQRREANIRDPDIITRIFGSRFLPATLYFDDATMLEEDRAAYFDGSKPDDGIYKAKQIEERTQVSLSRRTRTAKSGRLYTSEYGIKSLRFKGQVYGIIDGLALEDEPEYNYSLLLLVAGLKSIDRIGGNKSSGAGQVTCTINDPVLVNGNSVNQRYLLELAPENLEYYKLAREMQA